jgi:hypothetical protein
MADAEKAGHRLVLAEEFEGDTLNTDLWLPYYLPHWSSRDRVVPRYTLGDSLLSLEIHRDMEPWCPEFDGPVVVSCIQSGLFAGPLGSKIGQLRFNEQCTVREEQENWIGFLVRHGYIEIRFRVIGTPLTLASLWMIGYEDIPERSAEICVVELKGWEKIGNRNLVGYGLHPWSDPAIGDDFREERQPIDWADFHTYAIDWRPDGIDWYLDGRFLGSSGQSPAYPMQFMLGIYELPHMTEHRDDASAYPKRFEIDYLRVYEPIA